MILREENDTFILTRQHDHAHLSGAIARRFHHFFVGDPLFEDVLFAIDQHDRSWILPDTNPKWNPQKNRPYDFIDYPLAEKLDYYGIGLDETEKLNPYAGLLCSMHYTSFIKKDTAEKVALEFLQTERNRQNKLRERLVFSAESELVRHFQLLQLCDNLSLYLCLNFPGTDKVQEHKFFKNGFKNSATFNPLNSNDLMPRWPDPREVNIFPFPFQAPFPVSIDQLLLSKSAIRKEGLENAYRQAAIKPMAVLFSP